MTIARLTRTCTFVVSAFAGLALVSAGAAAQSLALAPAEVVATFKPGQPFQFDVAVANDGPQEMLMRTSVMDLWYNAKNEKIFGPAGSLSHSAGNWIEFVPRQFMVPAHGTGKVKVTVTPPKQASGGYYAVLFVESKPQLARAASAQTHALFTNIRLGSLILLSAEGTEKESVELSEAKLTPPRTNQNFKLEFSLANQGNTHIFPQAKVALLNDRKALVARAESEPKRLFPGQKDKMEVTWAGALPAGNYQAILTVIYGKDKVFTREFAFSTATP